MIYFIKSLFSGSEFPKRVLSFDCERRSLDTNSELAFDFINGACSSNNVQIMLCFSSQDSQQCYTSYDPVPRYWWQKFTPVAKSSLEHKSIAISMSEDKTFALGSVGHSTTELLDLSYWTWNTSTPYFNYKEIHSFATFVYEPGKLQPHLTRFYVIAGKTDKGLISDIAYFNPKIQFWNHVGQLQISRHGHQVTMVESRLYVFGGSKTAEKCQLSEKSSQKITFECTKLVVGGRSSNFRDDEYPQVYGHRRSQCNIGASSILILNTRKEHLPVLTNIDGLFTKLNKTRFDTEKDATSIYRIWGSCGIEFKGDFYIYGSYINDQDQILKVQDCSLKQIGKLPFLHEFGSCSAPSDEIYLCFGRDHSQKCFVANEPDFSKFTETQSLLKHYKIRTAASQGSFD